MAQSWDRRPDGERRGTDQQPGVTHRRGRNRTSAVSHIRPPRLRSHELSRTKLTITDRNRSYRPARRRRFAAPERPLLRSCFDDVAAVTYLFLQNHTSEPTGVRRPGQPDPVIAGGGTWSMQIGHPVSDHRRSETVAAEIPVDRAREPDVAFIGSSGDGLARATAGHLIRDRIPCTSSES